MDTKRVAYQYGLLVARRERLADNAGAYGIFQIVDSQCLRFWHRLKQDYAYQDAEGSTLKPDYVPYYEAGMLGIPFEDVKQP